jgi:hypothetical protein
MNFFKKILFTIKNEFKPEKFFDYTIMEERKVKCEKCFLHACYTYWVGDYPKPAELKGRCIWHKKKF